MLVQFTKKDFDRYLEKSNFISVGPNTITNKKAFRREIEKVGKQGYAVSMGEGIPLGASLSVPITKYILPATMSIVGPDQRWTKKMLDYLKDLKKAKDRLEDKISFKRGPT